MDTVESRKSNSTFGGDGRENKKNPDRKNDYVYTYRRA